MKPVSKIKEALIESGHDLSNVDKIYPTGLLRLKDGSKINYKKFLKEQNPFEIEVIVLDSEIKEIISNDSEIIEVSMEETEPEIKFFEVKADTPKTRKKRK